MFPLKDLPALTSDLTKHKTPREIRFQIPAFNSTYAFGLIFIYLAFLFVILASCF